MEKKNLYLIAIAVIICIALGCLSPFIASTNPDGLEKSAEDSHVEETEPLLKSPFPDYTLESLGTTGEILVLILGAIITLIVAYSLGKLVQKRRN